MQLSGQRRVPVLKDGDVVVSDSTEIAFYLERKYPEPALLPDSPRDRGLCLLIEEWADESIGLKARQALVGAFNKNENFRTSVLPAETPDFLKTLVGALPGDVLDILGAGVGFGGEAVKAAQNSLKQDLEALCLMLQDSPYLIGDRPTLADLTVAGLSILLKFPDGNYLDIPPALKGKGIPGLADSSFFEPFFIWRDRLYRDFRKTGTSSSTSGEPTTIDID